MNMLLYLCVILPAPNQINIYEFAFELTSIGYALEMHQSVPHQLIDIDHTRD